MQSEFPNMSCSNRAKRITLVLVIVTSLSGIPSNTARANLCKGVSDIGNNHFKIDSKVMGQSLGDNQIFNPTVGGKQSDATNTLYAKHLTVLDDGEGCVCLFWLFSCLWDWCNGPWAKWRIAVAPNGTKLGAMQDDDGQFEPAIDSLAIKNFTQLAGPFSSDSGGCEWWEVDEHGNDGEDPIGIQYGHYVNNPLWDWDNFCFSSGCYNILEILIYESDDCWGPFCGSDDVRAYFTIDKSIQMGSVENENLKFVMEVPYKVDPNKVDTDSDGIPDVLEINQYKTDPKNPDTDGDGLNDGLEINQYKTDPKKADTDGDGLSDGLEVNTYNTDPKNPYTDTDGDGLSDSNEIVKYKTDPKKSDTDGDGLSDGDEVNKYKTSPTSADTDEDGRADGAEVKKGTNPLCPSPILGKEKQPPIPQGCPAYGPLQPNIGKPMDMDGDGRAELISFSRDHKWYVDLSSVGPTQFSGIPFPAGKPKDNYGTWNLVFDLSKDVTIAKDAMLFPVVMDYNTDGKTDLGLYDSVHGKWYVSFTTSNTLNTNNAVNGVNPWPGWDMVIDYSGQPHWKPFSRPVLGNFNGQDDDPSIFDNYMDVALQTPDGWWLIDSGGNGKTNYGIFDKAIKYLTDIQLAEAPAWAWLPAVYSSYGNLEEQGTIIAIKSPDGLSDPKKSNQMLIMGVGNQILFNLEGDYSAFDNSIILMQGKFQTKTYTDIGIKKSDPTFGAWFVASSQSNWIDMIEIDAHQNFGDAHCLPIPADYDGDGYDDRAVQCGADWKINYSGSKYPINTNKQIAITWEGKQIILSESFRTMTLPTTQEPLPGYVYPGGVSYQKLYEMYKNYNFLCILGSGPPKFTCDISHAMPPISPYLPQCIADGKDLLTCLMP